ncbi:pseudouridine synthase, partial [Gaertneriomyces semiglobifer]
MEILYYDPEHYLITNKPYSVRIDGDTESCPTSESLLYRDFQQHEKLYLLHQLDYVTSGVHCWGLSKKAAGIAGKAFSRRQVKKTYTALVRGHLEQDEMEITTPLMDDPADDKKTIVAPSEELGKACQTHVQLIRRGYFFDTPVTHVELSPVTGRRHQLRVHMASIGHPIIGDPTYEVPHTSSAFRCMLHSWRLALPQPNGEVLRFEAKEPFADLI